jgi:hypothetical protein
MDRSRRARVALVGLLATLAACAGDDNQAALPLPLDVPDTVAIGVLPDQPSDAATLPPPPPPPTTAPTATTTAAPAPIGPIDGTIGEAVEGNRILLIGDSILAATTPRHDGLMCDALVLFGWKAEIDAESGRDIQFANEVLDDRLSGPNSDEWDAVALSFGSQVQGTDSKAVDRFEAALDAVIDRISPRPVALFTLADTGVSAEVVNDVIRSRRDTHPNVVIVEFADAGSDGVPVIDDTSRTLTDDGMKRLSIRTAAAVGKAQGDALGECLPSDYTNDSNSSNG